MSFSLVTLIPMYTFSSLLNHKQWLVFMNNMLQLLVKQGRTYNCKLIYGHQKLLTYFKQSETTC